MKKNDHVRHKDGRSGTVVYVYPPFSDGTVLVQWKGCCQHYVSNATALEIIPADYKPRWRIER